MAHLHQFEGYIDMIFKLFIFIIVIIIIHIIIDELPLNNANWREPSETGNPVEQGETLVFPIEDGHNPTVNGQEEVIDGRQQSSIMREYLTKKRKEQDIMARNEDREQRKKDDFISRQQLRRAREKYDAEAREDLRRQREHIHMKEWSELETQRRTFEAENRKLQEENKLLQQNNRMLQQENKILQQKNEEIENTPPNETVQQEAAALHVKQGCRSKGHSDGICKGKCKMGCAVKENPPHYDPGSSELTDLPSLHSMHSIRPNQEIHVSHDQQKQKKKNEETKPSEEQLIGETEETLPIYLELSSTTSNPTDNPQVAAEEEASSEQDILTESEGSDNPKEESIESDTSERMLSDKVHEPGG